MKAQELRISNIVERFNYNIDDWSVINITVDDLIIMESGLEIDYSPIQLTGEWLLNLGFKREGNNEYVKGNFVIRKRQMDLHIVGDTYDFNGILISAPEYVHQLQNLYFALTGEELTMQP